MSNQQNDSMAVQEHEAPGYEPWLGVASASFVPLLLGFFLPSQFLMPLLAMAGVLVAAGVVMLIRESRRSERQPD